ncbi:hypothetical protein AB0F72_09365 [Actinoplanes sp. NPDC023936]|uniref:hypothetical protein n=1 Tax=Actinoplanes sp. NPDC023936 TaxID=3154910 RepID=UPI0033F0706C
MTEARTWTLTIPAPDKMLSANTRLHWRTLRRVAKAWREASYTYAQQAKLPVGLDRVRIDITLHHTVNRDRDDANWYPYLGKPITDGLGAQRTVQQKDGATRVEVGYGLVPDDSPAHVDGPFMHLGDKVSRKEYPLGLAVVTIVDLSGEPSSVFQTERRVTSATTVWTFRCPARHQVTVTLRHGEAEVQDEYRALFEAQHVGCEAAS